LGGPAHPPTPPGVGEQVNEMSKMRCGSETKQNRQNYKRLNSQACIWSAGFARNAGRGWFVAQQAAVGKTALHLPRFIDKILIPAL
jgi:hypothetical protein